MFTSLTASNFSLIVYYVQSSIILENYSSCVLYLYLYFEKIEKTFEKYNRFVLGTPCLGRVNDGV